MRDLAGSLGRDYKNVHQDVSALEAGGLLVRDGRRLTAPWNEVQASINRVAVLRVHSSGRDSRSAPLFVAEKEPA